MRFIGSTSSRRRFVASFTDADDELLMFDTRSLLYLEVPGNWVHEAFEELREKL